jgi:8-oxo-dGTP diphosphatase
VAGKAASVFVTVDIVIPRISSAGSGWEVVLIQRKRQPYAGMWALPGGHLTHEDASLEAVAQRERRKKRDLISLCTFFNRSIRSRILRTRAASMCAYSMC